MATTSKYFARPSEFKPDFHLIKFYIRERKAVGGRGKALLNGGKFISEFSYKKATKRRELMISALLSSLSIMVEINLLSELEPAKWDKIWYATIMSECLYCSSKTQIEASLTSLSLKGS